MRYLSLLIAPPISTFYIYVLITLGDTMKTLRWLFLLSIVFSFSLFAQTTTSNQQGTENWTKVRQNIQELGNKMEKAMIDMDHAYLISLYADDAISMPSYSPMVKGKSAIEQMGKKDIEMGTKYKSFDTKTTDFYGAGKYAFEIGTYTINFSTSKMPDIKDHGKYVTIWEKQDDNTWKIKVETWNSDVNPYESMMSESESTKHEKAGVKSDKDKDVDRGDTDDQKTPDESGDEKK